MNSPAIIKQRRDTAANWAAGTAQPLYDGQLGIEITKNAQNKLTDAKLKIGDGISTWSELPYLSVPALSNATNSTQSGYFGDIYLWDDSTPSHYLRITNSANLTDARVLSLNVNNADRTVSLNGDLTVSTPGATISNTNTGDQNLFSKFAVSGQTDISANSATTTLNIAAGTNIDLKTSDTTKTLTISHLPRSVIIANNVDVATTQNLTSLSGLGQSIDGVTLQAGDRVLVKDQTNPKQNGIYVASAGTWTRASDFNAIQPDKIDTNKTVGVLRGENAGSRWSLITETFTTLGNTDLLWAEAVAPIVLRNVGDSGFNITAGKGTEASTGAVELSFKKLSYDNDIGVKFEQRVQTGESIILTIDPSIPLSKGGTGATDAANARSNLGAAADADVVKLTGDQSDITGTKTFTGTLYSYGTFKLGSAPGYGAIKDMNGSGLMEFKSLDAIFLGDLILSSSTGNKSLRRAEGAAPSITLSSTTADVTFGGDISVNGGDIKTNQTTFNLINDVATTLNIGNKATAVTIGETTGTTTIRNVLNKPKLQGYWETLNSPTISSGTLTLNLALANVFNVALNANVTTLTISNTPTGTGTVGFTLMLTADGTARTITWPASVKWAGGTAPTLTSTNGKVDILSFISVNNGTTWFGFIGGQNF